MVRPKPFYGSIGVDPFALAAFSVSWAGESHSLNWFDTARELTERWHHLYRDIEAPVGTLVACNISGEAGGRWLLRRGGLAWSLVTQAFDAPASEVTVPQELAWRPFTKGIDVESARRQVRLDCDRRLAEHALRLTAIVA